MIRSLYKLLLHDDEGIINMYIIAVVVLPLAWKMSRPSHHVHTVASFCCYRTERHQDVLTGLTGEQLLASVASISSWLLVLRSEENEPTTRLLLRKNS